MSSTAPAGDGAVSVVASAAGLVTGYPIGVGVADAIARLDHVRRVQRSQPRRTVPEDVERSVRTHDRPRSLPVKDVARDLDWGRERRAAISRGNKVDRRLNVTPGVRIEKETRPRNVNAVLERAACLGVDRDPLFVIQSRRRGRRVDEGRRSPAQMATGVEGALAYLHRVRRAG